MKETYKIIGLAFFLVLTAFEAWNVWLSLVIYWIVVECIDFFVGRTVSVQPSQMISEKISYFEKAHVSDAYVPLIDVISIDKSASVSMAIESFITHGTSRLVVFDKHVEHIVGTLSYHDLFSLPPTQESLEGLIQPPHFIPEVVALPKLLVTMQKEGISLCIVLDEFNQVSGVISVEDIIEELVGEISDEFEMEPPLFKKVSSSSYLISGRMEIDHMNELFHWGVPKNNYETLAGFLMDQLGKIGLEGESVKFGHLVFTIRDASSRSINLIHVRER